MDELIQEKVAQKENELNATYDERIRNYEERWVVTITAIFPHNHSPDIERKTFKNKFL
jgi:hypothetical protein